MEKLFELFGYIKIDDDAAEQKLNDIDDQAEETGNKMSNMGGKVVAAGKAVGVGLTVVTAAVGAATTAISESTDAIDKGAQNIGFSTDAYQEWSYVLSQNGSDIETVSGGIAALTEKAVDAANGGESNAEAFAKLGLTVEELSGLTQQEIFEKTIEGLQNMTNETERAALASELMGGAGEELGALLNGTSEDIANMRNEAHNLNLVMDAATIKAGVDMTDSLDRMKTSFMSMLAEALAPLMPVIIELIEKLLPVLTRLLDAIIPVLEPLIDVFMILVDSALLPLIDAIMPLIETLLPPLTNLLNLLMPVIEALANVISFVLVEAVDQVTERFETFFGIVGKVSDAVSGFKDKASGIFEGVGDFFTGSSGANNTTEYASSYLPSFATGIDRVPYDMTANIHKDEMILNKSDANDYRNGRSGGVTLNINNPQVIGDQGVEDFANILTDYLRGRGVYA